MKTKLLLLLLLANFSIYAQTTAIPDINFEKKLIALGIDSGTPDGQVLTSKVSSLTRLDVSFSSIADLTGIEAFTSLIELTCYYNSLTALNLSKNTNLQALYCSDNQLETLDLSNNIKLLNLSCGQNKLTSLNLTKNSALSDLSCSSNKLTSIDLTNNVALKDLSLYQNQLTSLDLSKNVLLARFSCEGNYLTSLNLTNNPSLVNLTAGRNNFTSLDLSKNLDLQAVHIYNGSLTTLNISKNINLKTLTCSSNRLTSLDVSNNLYLNYLECSSNLLTSLDVSKNILLTNLSCGYNSAITTLNVASNTALKTLDIASCKLTTIDVSLNKDLTSLNVSSNKLSSLNVSSNTNLKSLSCSNNTLTSLDITQLGSLNELQCNNNQLTDLNVSKNSNLNVINCSGNKLTSLDLSNNKILTDLSCQSNKITTLDFSKNTSLVNLNCSSNSLLNLNLKNGKNSLINKVFFNINTNPTLLCVQVDDIAFSNANWTKKDAGTSFNTNCNQYTAIPDPAFESKLIALGFDTDGKNGLVLNSNIAALTSLNVSNSSITNLSGIEGFVSLKDLNCSNNLLENLDLSKNTAINSLNTTGNKSLTCVQVANVSEINNWTITKDAITSFGIDCNAYTLIPDSKFEDKLIALGIDTDGKNGKVITKSISSITSLDVTNSSISDLTGIQDFTALKELSCAQNSFETVDLSKNIALTSFYSSGNSGSAVGGGNGKLKSLDFSKNTNLKSLSCSLNQISSLNISGCNQLTYLDCSSNNISYIDITSTSLTSLNVYGNPFTNIDVTKNPKLTYLDVGYTKIKAIDLSNTPLLESFFCHNNSVTSLDISKCPNIIYLNVSYNQLVNLNLKNNNNRKIATNISFYNFKNNPNLTCIQVDDVSFANANLSALKDGTASFSAFCEPVVAYTTIPDINFEKKLIALGIDKDGENGKVATSSITSVASLNVSGSNIKDLTGIKDFASLNSLDCSNNQLTVLDVSENNNLKKLNVSKNQLSKLALDKNAPLNDLNISNNNFVSIDISKNTNLSTFNCSYNNFIVLNTANNTNLTFLSCGFNKLANLDVSKNTNLKELECSNNNIYNLNLKNGNNANMQRMIFGNFTNNPNLSCIQVDNAAYSTENWIAKDSNASYSEACAENIQYTLIPDVNFENALIALGYDSGKADGKVLTSKINTVTSLYVVEKSITNLKGIEDFTSLSIFSCSANQVTSLDVSKNSALTVLYCDRNKLTTLDVSKNTGLVTLGISNNQIEDIDLSNNLFLVNFYGASNKLSSLNTSKNVKLGSLTIDNNKLSALDISQNTELKELYCSTNTLNSLNISKNVNLMYLNVYYNNLTSLDVSKNTALSTLDCSYNKLSSINVSKNKALSTFYCSSNKITDLDLSGNTALTKFFCGGNTLKSLNLKNGNNTKLTVSLTSNPNLSCIQVDDVDYANNNWSAQKDKTASFNVDCAFSTLIPDPAFEDKLIALEIDKDGKNGKVLTSSIVNLTSLDVSGSQINDLTGIQDFTALESLTASENNLTKIDVSKNQNLTRLNVGQNKLTALNVINNVALQAIYCNNNAIKSLDLSKNVKLTEIYCPDNKLVFLNLKNGNNAANNGPSIKNFTNNPDLTCIQVDDVNYSNTNWAYFKDATANYSSNCDYFTAIPDINFEKKLIALGIDTDGENGKVATSNILYIKDLDVSSSSIKDLTGIQDFISLERLSSKSNQLTTLDLSKNTALYSLTADSNSLTTVNITGNQALTTLSLSSNRIADLDISKNTALNYLDLGYNQIKRLDASNHKKLVSLKVNNNQLVYLNLQNGKNQLLTNANFTCKGNLLLSCILVDDINYANTNWLDKKDNAANYNTECTGELALPVNNFTVETKGESCLGENNGEITIVGTAPLAYNATINDKPYTFTNNALKLTALTPGVYNIKITIPEMIYEQIFNVTIQKGATATGKSSISAKNVEVEITEGTAPFTVFVNGTEQFQTTDTNFTVSMQTSGLVEVATAKACEGVFAKKVSSYELGTILAAYPNPTTGIIEIEIPSTKTEIAIELYNFGGQLVSHGTYTIENGKALLNLEKLPSGIYAAKVNLETPEYIKIIKK